MEIKEGWLSIAEQIPSDNCDDRPAGEISLVVIHCISLPAGHYGNDFVRGLFTNSLTLNSHPDFADLKNLHVASHLFIRRNGKIEQFVPFTRRAWHAGASQFAGRDNCNDFSVGIELEGVDSDGFTNAQYEQLVRVCDCLRNEYVISMDNIVGHSDIAPGRKTDPGVMFDWSRLKAGMSDK